MSRGSRLTLRKLVNAVVITVVAAALITILATWLFYHGTVRVRISVEPYSFPRYDDGAGHLPLGAVVRIVNTSVNTVWTLEGAYEVQQLVDEKWTSSGTSSGVAPPGPGEWVAKPYRWTAIHAGETRVLVVGPISENTAELRVGVPFTADWFPKTALWLFSPVVKILKKEQGSFPEPIRGSEQEEQVLLLR
jgi:hypothetical protein